MVATMTPEHFPTITNFNDPARAIPNKTPRPAAVNPIVTSAQSQIQQTLNTFGLGGLTQWAWDKVKAGESLDQIVIEMRQRPEYQQRFPAMQQLSNAGRAITEAQYMSLEDSYRQVLKAAGMPTGFYDQPDDFANFIVQDVSPSELKSRTDMAQQAVYSATPEFRQHLNDYYGIDQGHLTSYFLDPNRALPLLQQRFTSAQLGTEAQYSGFGNLSQAEAERLANIGVQPGTTAQSTFGQLGQQSQLFRALPGENVPGISREEQLAAGFESDAQATQDINAMKALRKADFSGGGQYSTSQAGFSGLGPANTA